MGGATLNYGCVEQLCVGFELAGPRYWLTEGCNVEE